MNDAKIREKVEQFKKEENLEKVDYESLSSVLERRGFTTIEFSQTANDENVAELIDALELGEMVCSSRGFTYANSGFRLVFISNELSTKEKTIIIAHELGHIILGHLNSQPILGKDVTDEYEANIFAHLLLRNNKRLFCARNIAIVAGIVVGIAVAILAFGNSKVDDEPQSVRVLKAEDDGADSENSSNSSDTYGSSGANSGSTNDAGSDNAREPQTYGGGQYDYFGSQEAFEQSEIYSMAYNTIKNISVQFDPEITYDAANGLMQVYVDAPAGTSTALVSNPDGMRESWNEFCEALRGASLTMARRCEEKNYDIGCGVIVCNDLTRNKVLYSALNGQVISDFLNE